MSTNKKVTSKKISSLASQILNDDNSSKTAKILAGSALAQAEPGKQTGSEVEELASKVLESNKYSEETKSLAGSVLAQSNKER